MRFALLLVLFFAGGCGSDSHGGGGGSSSPAVDVADFKLYFGPCTLGASGICTLYTNVTFTSGDATTLPAGLTLFIQGNNTAAPAAACDATGVDVGAIDSFSLPIPAHPAMTISDRVCVHNAAAGTFSPGLTATVITPVVL